MMATAKVKAESKQRVQEWAEKLDIEIQALAIRPISSKWALCSTNGRLNFNDELLDLDEDLGDFVIVHELLHFLLSNHRKLWKALMFSHLGLERA